MSEISDYIRKSFTEGDNKRDSGLTIPPEIVQYNDILYGQDARWQVLDVYRTKENLGKILPVIVSVHGGGWVYGDKERYRYYCMNLAQRGFAVVNFTYRLAPENKFPCALEDVNSVFTWVQENAGQYGMDGKNVFGVGDSAGAHLLALYSAICTNPQYAENYEFKPPKGFVPKALALNCGSYKIVMDNPEDLTQKLLKEFLPGKGTLEEQEMVSVVNHVTEGFPPAYVMTAIDDFVKPQSSFLEERLKRCRVPHVYHVYGDADNRLGHVFHCNIKTASAAQCNDEECRFLMKYYSP